MEGPAVRLEPELRNEPNARERDGAGDLDGLRNEPTGSNLPDSQNEDREGVEFEELNGAGTAAAGAVDRQSAAANFDGHRRDRGHGSVVGGIAATAQVAGAEAAECRTRRGGQSTG